MTLPRPTFTALSDGTHIHHRAWGDKYCTQTHKKKLSPAIQLAIYSGWFVAFVLAAHLILKSNNL